MSPSWQPVVQPRRCGPGDGKFVPTKRLYEMFIGDIEKAASNTSCIKALMNVIAEKGSINKWSAERSNTAIAQLMLYSTRLHPM